MIYSDSRAKTIDELYDNEPWNPSVIDTLTELTDNEYIPSLYHVLWALIKWERSKIFTQPQL